MTGLCNCAHAQVDPKGATILAGFNDGVVRVLNFQKQEVIDVHGKKKEVRQKNPWLLS